MAAKPKYQRGGGFHSKRGLSSPSADRLRATYSLFTCFCYCSLSEIAHILAVQESTDVNYRQRLPQTYQLKVLLKTLNNVRRLHFN